MWMLVVLAFRNLVRHLRRTIITASAIAFGLFFFLIASAIGDGGYRNTVENAVALMSGHVVVQAKGFQEKREVELLVHDAERTLSKVHETFPGQTALPRIFMGGLLSSPQGSSGVSLTGVVPVVEAGVSDLDDKIVEGEFLSGSDSEIVIGRTLAETLGVGLGDKVVYMHQVGGELQSRLFRVKGIFRTGVDELDGFFGLVSLTAAQDALGIEDAVSQIALIISQDDDLDADVQTLSAALARPELEVLTWMKAMPEVYEYIIADKVSMWVMIGLIAIIAAIGVLNTVLMSVLERTREFGTMLALGMSPRKLGFLVLFESTLLGVLAALLGGGLGVLGALYFQRYGIDYSGFMGAESMTIAGVPMDTLLYGYIAWPKFITVCLLTVVVTVVSSLYPMWWVSRLRPVIAMARRK